MKNIRYDWKIRSDDYFEMSTSSQSMGWSLFWCWNRGLPRVPHATRTPDIWQINYLYSNRGRADYAHQLLLATPNFLIFWNPYNSYQLSIIWVFWFWELANLVIDIFTGWSSTIFLLSKWLRIEQLELCKQICFKIEMLRQKLFHHKVLLSTFYQLTILININEFFMF